MSKVPLASIEGNNSDDLEAQLVTAIEAWAKISPSKYDWVLNIAQNDPISSFSMRSPPGLEDDFDDKNIDSPVKGGNSPLKSIGTTVGGSYSLDSQTLPKFSLCLPNGSQVQVNYIEALLHRECYCSLCINNTDTKHIPFHCLHIEYDAPESSNTFNLYFPVYLADISKTKQGVLKIFQQRLSFPVPCSEEVEGVKMHLSEVSLTVDDTSKDWLSLLLIGGGVLQEKALGYIQPRTPFDDCHGRNQMKYRVKYGDITLAAVARNESYMNPNQKVLARELYILQRLHLNQHTISAQKCRHVIQLLGARNDDIGVVEHMGLCAIRNEIFMTSRLQTVGNLRQVMVKAKNDPDFCFCPVEGMVQILSAIDYMHQSGIVHLDMKPENVFVSVKEKAKDLCLSSFCFKVGDLELSRPIDCKNLKEGILIGTSGYIPPETYHFYHKAGINLRSKCFCKVMNDYTGIVECKACFWVHSPVGEPLKQVDFSADSWSCGVIFCELLTGQKWLKNYMVPSKLVESIKRQAISREMTNLIRGHFLCTWEGLDTRDLKKQTVFFDPVLKSSAASRNRNVDPSRIQAYINEEWQEVFDVVKGLLIPKPSERLPVGQARNRLFACILSARYPKISPERLLQFLV